MLRPITPYPWQIPPPPRGLTFPRLLAFFSPGFFNFFGKVPCPRQPESGPPANRRCERRRNQGQLWQQGSGRHLHCGKQGIQACKRASRNRHANNGSYGTRGNRACARMGGHAGRANEYLHAVFFGIVLQIPGAFWRSVGGAYRNLRLDSQIGQNLQAGLHLVLVGRGTHHCKNIRHCYSFIFIDFVLFLKIQGQANRTMVRTMDILFRSRRP